MEENKLLLVRQHVPTRPNPVWLAPGGEVELGETAAEAAKRETFEETGLIIEPKRLIAVHEFVEPPFQAVELYFFSNPIGGMLIVGSDPEHGDNDHHILDCQYLGFDELARMENISPQFLKNMREDHLFEENRNLYHFENNSDSKSS